MREALQETVRRNSLLFLVQAALMIVAGLAAFIYPLLSSVALAVFLGWMLIFAGAAQVISLIGATKVPHFWLQLVSAVLAVLIGPASTALAAFTMAASRLCHPASANRR